MNDAKIEQVLRRYGSHAANKSTLNLTHQDREFYSHIERMLPKMRVFMEEGRREKLMRWLGFIQGSLHAHGDFTLDELKSHNRRD